MNDQPGLSKIRQIAVVVGDVEGAVTFYRDVLGLQFLFSAGPDLAFLRAGEIRIMLSTPQGAGQVGSNSILYFEVADAGAAHAELVRKGAGEDGGPNSRPGCPTTNSGSPSCAIPRGI